MPILRALSPWWEPRERSAESWALTRCFFRVHRSIYWSFSDFSSPGLWYRHSSCSATGFCCSSWEDLLRRAGVALHSLRISADLSLVFCCCDSSVHRPAPVSAGQSGGGPSGSSVVFTGGNSWSPSPIPRLTEVKSDGFFGAACIRRKRFDLPIGELYYFYLAMPLSQSLISHPQAAPLFFNEVAA